MVCDGFFTQLSGIRRGHTCLRGLGLLLFAMKLLLVEDSKKSVFQCIFLVGFFFFFHSNSSKRISLPLFVAKTKSLKCTALRKKQDKGAADPSGPWRPRSASFPGEDRTSRGPLGAWAQGSPADP